MPNFCFNSATFSHEDPDKVAALAKAFSEGNPFMTFMPPPGGEWDYGWCSENWGTKWDVEAGDAIEIEDGTFSVWFDSAWAPPIGFYSHLVNEGWNVDATYHESGMCFAGHFEDGSDYYVEYDFSLEDWRDGIEDSEVLEILEQEYDSYILWKEEEEQEENLPKNDEAGC
jgi:hypothetical protein